MPGVTHRTQCSIPRGPKGSLLVPTSKHKKKKKRKDRTEKEKKKKEKKKKEKKKKEKKKKESSMNRMLQIKTHGTRYVLARVSYCNSPFCNTPHRNLAQHR